ncbi:MAG TPA: D-sedoheptulose 7-phosphate isomerase [Planctomycetota bacterium]|nr:D-sedoheptulose 7-phosphate isomerase [Planctomycetota bacterium]
MNVKHKVEDSLAQSAFVKLLLLQRQSGVIADIGTTLARILKGGKTIFLFGNGGSAADAQHIAAELEARFLKERRALRCHALTTNTSTLTAVGNDYGYQYTFSRQVEAYCRKGDAVIAISTSGNSPNVLEAVKRAKKLGALAVGFTNEKGGKLRALVDLCLQVPSTDTQRVQECHLAVGHIVCDIIESTLFG